MASSWKKSWTVAIYPVAVIRALKRLPKIYQAAFQDGVLGWVGRTFAHQRKDFRPKPPRLAVDQGSRLVFQHDLVSPITYAVECTQDDDSTRVQVEVKTGGSGRDSGAAEQVVTLLYVLTKMLERDPR